METSNGETDKYCWNCPASLLATPPERRDDGTPICPNCGCQYPEKSESKMKA